MAEKIPNFRNREEEAQYWNHEDVTRHLDEIEPVDVNVKAPLIHTLSVRVSAQDLKRLRELGQESGLGTTTMARYLLRQALKQPQAQLAWAALQDENIPSEVQAMVEESKIPADSNDPDMYFFSAKRMSGIREKVEQASAKAFLEAMHEFGKIGPGDAEYERLKELEDEASATAK